MCIRDRGLARYMNMRIQEIGRTLSCYKDINLLKVTLFYKPVDFNEIFAFKHLFLLFFWKHVFRETPKLE